jgi:hypothetical protein
VTAPTRQPSPEDSAGGRTGVGDGSGLARQIDRFAATLDDREISLLKRVFVAAMTPLERLRYLDQEDLLSAEEWQALRGAPPS